MLIAEIGNNHFGDMQSAKEHIIGAKESGADAAKFQAFAPGDFKGSMPLEFYKQCAFSFEQYMELLAFGKYLKIPVFFSIFNNDLLELEHFTEYTKLAAWQTNEYTARELSEIDNENTIISLNSDCKSLPALNHAIILYATEYNCTDPVLERLGILQRFYKRGIGLSDHSIGIQTCQEAINLYEVPVIEKHFTLCKNMKFLGQIFRDTVHAADPVEFTELSKYFKYKKSSYKGGNHGEYTVQ